MQCVKRKKKPLSVGKKQAIMYKSAFAVYFFRKTWYNCKVKAPIGGVDLLFYVRKYMQIDVLSIREILQSEKRCGSLA